MHALEEYGLMHVKLYEDIAKNGEIATTYAYPVKVEGRYVMDPSPTPKFDNPKMHMSAALQLFGAGREKRIYPLPPYTEVVSLDFEDHPFEVQRFEQSCALCGLARQCRDVGVARLSKNLSGPPHVWAIDARWMSHWLPFLVKTNRKAPSGATGTMSISKPSSSYTPVTWAV